MDASNYPILALVAGLAALVVAASALLIRSQIAGMAGQKDGSPGAVSVEVARKLSHYLFGMAGLMLLLALTLELGNTISGVVGVSGAYVCESVLALSAGMISLICRHSYRNLRRDNGLG